MSQDIKSSSINHQKVFKFHNISKEGFFSNRKSKRKLPLDPKIATCQSEKTLQILNAYIPIRQKSVCTPKIQFDDDTKEEKKGVKLVDINILLEQPESQEKPLDLSTKNTGLQFDVSPLDLSRKGEKIAVETECERKATHETSTDDPYDFEGKAKSSSEQNVQKSLVTIDEENLQSQEKTTSISTVTVIKAESDFQESIRMVFNNGNFVEILPTPSQPPKIQQKKISVADKRRPRQAQSKKDHKNMIKTAETLTNNGAMFCTFRNFNQNRPKKVRLKRTACKNLSR